MSKALETLRATQVGQLKNGVPKIIHQTWKTANVPEHWAASSEWARLHPDWLYVLWTDDDIRVYIQTMWPAYTGVFEALPWPIQRVDLWRYFVLRDFGGLYCDLDIVAVKNIDEALSVSGDVFLVPSANSDGVYTNAIMASTRSGEAAKFFTKIIESVKGYQESPSISFASASSRHLEIMESTGPLALTRGSQESPFTSLPKKLWNPYDLSQADLPESQDSPEALVRILPGSSWHATDSTLFSFIFIYKGPIIAITVLFLIYYIIKSEIFKEKFKYVRKRFWRRKLD